MRLVLRGITKRFGSVVANDSMSLTVEPGEIHCLLGENGAGKSTLMNVLYGLYKADEGEIELDGVVQHFTGPGDAMAAGIGMVHQHFMLIPVFTVAENVMLGNESTGFAGTLDVSGAREAVNEISERFGFHVDPDALVEDLPVGVQQRVEIIKALSRDAGLLVFDEPTAVLTPQETDELMDIMRQLREAGKAIVFITHKLREVRAVADRITVIRLGKVVGEADPKASNAELASMMVGRPVELTVHKDAPQLGADALVVSDLRVTDAAGHQHVDGISFTVRAGEVLAVAGVQGNGQTELTEALVGLQDDVTGSITLDGVELVGRRRAPSWTQGSGSSPRTARSTASCPASPSPRTSCSTAASGRRSSRTAACASAPCASSQSRSSRSTTSAPVTSTRWPATSRAATSRRSWWPASCRATCACWSPRSPPAGWTSVRSSSSTSRSSRPVTAASRSSWCRPSSTRWSPSPTGSWCSTAAGVVGIVPADTPRQTLGLMMTGERPKDLKDVVA